MIVKYAVEAAFIGYVTGKFYSPFDFFSPLLAARSRYMPLWDELAGDALDLVDGAIRLDRRLHERATSG